MQTRPRIALLVSLFAALVLIAGCSSAKNDAPLPDGASLVKDAEQTTRQQQSVHLLLTVAGTIPNLPISSLEGDLTNVPKVAAQGKASVPDFQLTDVPFVVSPDGTLYVALSQGGTMSPFGKATDLYDVGAILSPDRGLANVLANFTEAKADGRENVGDVATVKISGTVSSEAVNAIAPQIAASGPVPSTAWIREDGDHALVQAKLDVSPGNSVQMTLTDWGKPVTVTVPPAK